MMDVQYFGFKKAYPVIDYKNHNEPLERGVGRAALGHRKEEWVLPAWIKRRDSDPPDITALVHKQFSIAFMKGLEINSEENFGNK